MATCANWAFNVLFSQVSNIAITNISWRYYLVFICLNFVDFILIGLFFPETKGTVAAILPSSTTNDNFSLPRTGKTLEEMAEIFGDEIDAHDVLESANVHEKLDHDNLGEKSA